MVKSATRVRSSGFACGRGCTGESVRAIRWGRLSGLPNRNSEGWTNHPAWSGSTRRARIRLGTGSEGVVMTRATVLWVAAVLVLAPACRADEYGSPDLPLPPVQDDNSLAPLARPRELP